MSAQFESIKNKTVIGVFITNKHAAELTAMRPAFVSSSRYIRFIELAKANRDGDMVLYFFTRTTVNFPQKYVRGVYYDPRENRWRQRRFPLPHLLYDRGGGLSPRSNPLIRRFRELGIKNINARHFFDKWDLHHRLSRFSAIFPHLPATVKGEKASDALQMLHQHGSVYVKTRRGSSGVGVIRMEKLGPDGFRYYHSYGGQLSSEILSKRELAMLIDHYFARRPFIIQKPIDLLKKGQGIIDFRSEVQKNEKGRLVVAGTTARIGRPHSPIASHTRTEDYYPLEEFARSVLQLDAVKARQLKAKIHDFLHQVFRGVEPAYGPFGEMGIDFGLDTGGKLWLIECNSKSAKTALYYAYGGEVVRQSFYTLLRYARSLVRNQNY